VTVITRSGRRPGPATTLLLVHVVLTSVLFLSFGGYRNQPAKIESDGKYYYQFLVSAWFDHDLDFTNNYRVARKPFMVREVDHYGFANRLTATGRPLNMFTIGPAVLWSPFFAAAYGCGSLLSATGVLDSPPDGWERPFQLAVMSAAVVYSALTLVLLYQVLIDWFARRVVLVGLALAFWATNWLYYCVFEPSMSHVYDLFTLVLLLWVCRQAIQRGGVLRHAAVGLAAGLHVLVRTQNIVSVVLLLVYFALLSWFSRGRRGRPGRTGWELLALATALVVALLPLAVSNLALFGEVLVVPQYAEGRFMQWDAPNLYGVLFSGRNGLFSHHPVLLLGVAGLFWAISGWRRHRNLVLRLLLPLGLVFAAQLWINASAIDWWGGHAFGQRRLLSSLPVFVCGWCVLLQVLEDRRRALRWMPAAATSLAVTLNIYLTLIHVLAWSYDEPHDILVWLFVRDPAWIAAHLGGR
jgi:hypothetical protein